jgi:hypothetical protein
MITDELLQALASPDATRREGAERFLDGLPPLDRIRGLLRMVAAVHDDATAPSSNQQQQQQRAMILSKLAAILLRRDIRKLQSASDLVALVDPLVWRYLHLRSSCGDGGGDSSQAAPILHCLAQVCDNLHWCCDGQQQLGDNNRGGSSNNGSPGRDGAEAVQMILQRVRFPLLHVAMGLLVLWMPLCFPVFLTFVWILRKPPSHFRFVVTTISFLFFYIYL